jgi:hypothetical protein
MIQDRSERRYRRSPGRQYDYDPLQSLNDNRTGQSGHLDSSPLKERRSTQLATSGQAPTTTGLLGPRPDARRARQILRQNILASKSRTTTGLLEHAQQKIERHSDQLVPFEDVPEYEEAEDDPTLFSNRQARNNRPIQRHTPVRERYPDIEEEVEEGQWDEDEQELEYLDPDLGYEDEEEDPLDRRVAVGGARRAQTPTPRTSGLDARRASELDYDEDEEEEERPQKQGKQKKKGVSRRKLLFGGILLGGAAVAAVELGPKIPQALEQLGTNVEHQVEDAFNKGFSAGAEAVRKDFVNALDNLEGVSLDGAIDAAQLTRTAYDVFVNPIVTLAATVTGDFLKVTLGALITGRGWLQAIGHDSPTLAALQNVLETWVNQVAKMPKQLQAITDSDLDGAQSYLRALQRKIQAEQAILNGTAKPTPTPSTKATPKPNATGTSITNH